MTSAWWKFLAPANNSLRMALTLTPAFLMPGRMIIWEANH